MIYNSNLRIKTRICEWGKITLIFKYKSMAHIIRKDLYYPELSYKLNGIFFNVHNELGKFRLERQYCDRISEILLENNINFVREKDLKNIFSDVNLSGNIPDFIIDKSIIVDAKHKTFLNKNDYYQMMRYLEIANLPLGIIVNFRSHYLAPKRIVNPKYLNNTKDISALDISNPFESFEKNS